MLEVLHELRWGKHKGCLKLFSLGAPHDDDPNFPGGCSQRNFIMSGAKEGYQYFFSACSDRLISQFVRSESASCLRRLDESKSPVIDPSFANPKAPSMQEMCKRALKSDKAYIDEVL